MSLPANDLAPAWADQTYATRVAASAMLLHVHGFLSDAENERVRKRIEKWLTRQGYGVPPRSRR